MALTLTGNTFDGSVVGAILNNIQGPFTLSQTNSFVGAGHSGGYPVSISGVDVTVDGWTATTAANTLGVAGGNTGINVGIRGHRFNSSFSTGINITNNTINNPSHGVVMSDVLSATIDGNVLTGNGGHPASALFIANVPGNSTYSITNNTLTNPTWAGLNIGAVENPGMALTLERNIFDGSQVGAVLNNIQGPFTLSHSNSFAGAGHTGAYPVSISGVDLTVDGWTTLGVTGGNTGINVGIRGHRFNSSFSQGINITNNTVNNPSHGVVMSDVLSATIDGNVLAGNGGHPASALFIANVPGNSTYSITNNTLANPSGLGLNIGAVENPGMTLTLDGNTFDGSQWGAVLNNIQGPFTLSHTNSFAGAGHSGAYPVSISGVDVTVDGWTTLGVTGGNTGINVGIRGHRFNSSFSQGINITNNTVNNPSHGVVMSDVLSATIDGNVLAGNGGHPASALFIANVPGNSTYSITNNTLANPSGLGLNIGAVENPGMTLTLDGNTFDGSQWGAVLNNIQGPFTLSHTNSFAGAGHSGAYPVSISGVDVTVDGWTTLGVTGGNTGINVGIRGHRFNSSFSQGINITNNTVNNPSHGVVMSDVLSATIDGNVLAGNGGHPASALFIANVPGNSTYSITNNTLANPSGLGLNIGAVENPGMTLTLDGNTFDGSQWGAVLNNIQGPFTLSHTNSFAGAGHSGAYPVSISGVDVTVDGFVLGFATVDGGAGINVGMRSHRFSSSPSTGITISNTTVTGFGTGINADVTNASLTDLTLNNVTACGNNRGIGIRANGAQVLGGNVGGNTIDGVHVFGGSSNVLIDGVNFFDNLADVVDDAGGAGVTVQNSTNNPFNCPVPGSVTPPLCHGLPATIVGTDGPDFMVGTDGDDVMVGLDGDDTILGGSGNDTICAGPGDDIALGEMGKDWISGDEGHDRLGGGRGNDRVFGRQGSDVIFGGTGWDLLFGNRGHDTIFGGKGNDRIFGSRGHDTIFGGKGNDRIFGDRGHDRIFGGFGNDSIFGRIGDDTVVCGPGVDFVNGGLGVDTADATCEAQTNLP